MGLIRFLFLLLIAAVAWYVVKNYLRKQELRARRAQEAKKPVPRIVRCAQCEVHLPEDQALRVGDAWFCTPAHRQTWLAQNPDKRDPG